MPERKISQYGDKFNPTIRGLRAYKVNKTKRTPLSLFWLTLLLLWIPLPTYLYEKVQEIPHTPHISIYNHVFVCVFMVIYNHLYLTDVVYEPKRTENNRGAVSTMNIWQKFSIRYYEPRNDKLILTFDTSTDRDRFLVWMKKKKSKD